jgi:ABC-type arginine transport system permease subunit
MQIIATTTNEIFFLYIYIHYVYVVFSFLITLMKKQIQVSFNLINKSKKKSEFKKK